MSSSSDRIEDAIQSAAEYEDLKRQAIEGASSIAIYGVPLSRRAGAFFPFVHCLCVQDSPYNPCHCVGPILWIDFRDVLSTARTGRRCSDGREVSLLLVRKGSRLVEERHLSSTIEEFQGAAGGSRPGLRAGGASWPGDGRFIGPRTHGRETLDLLLRQPVAQAVWEAARADGVAVDAEALAVLSRPGLLFVNAPVAGVGRLDFGAMLDGRPVLDGTPVMYWHLSGRRLAEEGSPIPAGFYTVVADGPRARVRLRDARGEAVAEGDLEIGVGPSTGVAELKVSGGIDSFKFGKNSFKLCGHVEVSVAGAGVKLNGCIEASW